MGVDVDLLVESAAVQALLSCGVSPRYVAMHSPLGTRGIAVLGQSSRPQMRRMPRWTKEEDALLRACVGVLSDAEIGEMLGRTPEAVHLRRERDLGLTAPSKRPDEVTCEQIAQGLGIDGKSVARLIDRGFLPGRRLPMKTVIRVVSRQVLLRWMVNPMNWIYFKPARVGVLMPRRECTKYDRTFWRYVRRLLALKRARWDDEWWSIGPVAKFFGVNCKSVNQAVRRGQIPAVDWGNWWILRSVATDPRYRIHSQKGTPGVSRLGWTERGDAFLLVARGLGIHWSAIEKMTGVKQATLHNRLSGLRGRGEIPNIIKRFRLKVKYHSRTGGLSARYADHRGRFPILDRAVAKRSRGEPLTSIERSYMRGMQTR